MDELCHSLFDELETFVLINDAILVFVLSNENLLHLLSLL